jgi:hypothetical protein
MGWASAGEIFDSVAEGLIASDAHDDVKRKVLSRLCASLQDGDWDTEQESLERFADDPTIVLVFRNHGVTLEDDDDEDDDE